MCFLMSKRRMLGIVQDPERPLIGSIGTLGSLLHLVAEYEVF